MPSGEDGLGNGVQLLSELSVIKVDFDIFQGEEKHFKNNIHTNISWLKSFFNEIGLFVFVIHMERGNDHPINFQPAAINILSVYVSFANVET